MPQSGRFYSIQYLYSSARKSSVKARGGGKRAPEEVTRLPHGMQTSGGRGAKKRTARRRAPRTVPAQRISDKKHTICSARDEK